MNNKIVDIRDVSDTECAVTYMVLNTRKDTIYRKNSRVLINRIKMYLKYLNEKENEIRKNMENKALYKCLLYNLSIVLATLFLIYFIMASTIFKSTEVRLFGYIASLLIISFSFIISRNVTYNYDLRLENEILKNENEILRVESIRDSCMNALELEKNVSKNEKE